MLHDLCTDLHAGNGEHVQCPRAPGDCICFLCQGHFDNREDPVHEVVGRYCFWYGL